MSAQKTILDRIVTVIGTVSGVNLATQDVDAWNQSQPQNYNTVFVSGKKPTVDVLAYQHPTAHDMVAEMEVTIEGNVYEQYSEDVAGTLHTLMAAIEAALAADATLRGLVVDITLSSDEFVWSSNEKYGLFSAVYAVEYFYNHLAP